MFPVHDNLPCRSQFFHWKPQSSGIITQKETWWWKNFLYDRTLCTMSLFLRITRYKSKCPGTLNGNLAAVIQLWHFAIHCILQVLEHAMSLTWQQSMIHEKQNIFGSSLNLFPQVIHGHISAFIEIILQFNKLRCCFGKFTGSVWHLIKNVTNPAATTTHFK